MAEYNISAQITADTKGFESGVKKAQTASKKLGKSITDVVKGFGKSGLSGAITSAGLALGGIGLAVGTAVKAIKGITKALGECAEAYKVQLKAERALDTAINNSPYVSGTASKALKDFASEMQKVSNLGDEEIIPQMTQLIATGRTEAEVMKIIATASDMSASGAMSFDQAVTQLNATLNGNIGRLGQQNAELKALTKEELESGKAVEILGEKYKGLAQATTDTKTQMKNAIGDLKETFGSVFENAMAPMRKFFTEIIQGWADARKAKQEYEGAMIAIEKGEATANDYRIKEKKLLEEIEAIEGDLRKQAEEFGMTYEEAYSSMADWQRAQLEAMKDELDTTQKLARMHEGLEKIKKLEGQWAEEEAKKKQEEIEKETRIADLKDEYLKKIAEQEAKWQHIKEVTGEAVKEEEKIAFYQDSLVDLMTKAGGQITTNNQLYKDQIAIIQKLQAELNPEEQKTSTEWEKKLFQQTIERLEEEKQAMLESKAYAEMSAEDKYRIEKAYNDKLYELNLQRIQEEREKALESVEDFANAEEEKKRIMDYYQNLIKDNAKKYSTSMEKAGEEASKGFAKGFKNVLNEVSNIMQKIGKVIGKVIGKMFSGAKGIFTKLFDFNPDEALDGLLKFEDKILTFFVETLPKIPAFLASAFQSVATLLNTIFDSVNFESLLDSLVDSVTKILKDIPKLIVNAIPKMLKTVSTLFKEFRKILPGLKNTFQTIVGELFKYLPDFVKVELPTLLSDIVSLIPTLMGAGSTFIKALVSALPGIIQTVIDAFIEILKAPKEIADLAVSIVNAFVEVIMVVVRNIAPLLKALLPAIATIIIEIFKALPELLWSLTKEIGSMILEVGKWIVNLIIDGINKMLDGISKVWTWIPGTKGIPHISHFAKGTDNAPSGLALVGEAGPELVRFNGGEQVLNNRNTQKLLAGATSGGNTFNVTFNNLQDTSAYAMMSQLRQYNRQMAINGII